MAETTKHTPLHIVDRTDIGILEIMDRQGELVMYLDRGRAPITDDDRQLVRQVLNAANSHDALEAENAQLRVACQKFLIHIHHAYHIPGQTSPLSGRECLHCRLKWHADDEDQHDAHCPVTLARAVLK